MNCSDVGWLLVIFGFLGGICGFVLCGLLVSILGIGDERSNP
jgi:hypothetical protein